MNGVFYGIGVGPGDPELLTVKAVNVLKKIDVLAIPESRKDNESIAYSIARPYVSGNAKIISLTFPMIRDRKERSVIRKNNALQIKEYLEQGKDVAFITIGDPLTYSTYIYILEHLKEWGAGITTIPGITSFQGVASGLNIPLAVGDESIGIFCDIDSLPRDELFFNFDTFVFLKPRRYLDRLPGLFKGRKDFYDFYLVSNYGREEEVIRRDWNFTGKLRIPYLSTVILRRRKNGS